MFQTLFATNQLQQGKPVRLTLEADLEDRAMLAKRFDWVDVCSVKADLELKLIAGGAYLVKGNIEAAIIQRCRLSDNPVPESIVADVEERFANLDAINDTGAIDPMAVSVEALADDNIPVGEMIAQLVGLEASPWPRDPDADENAFLRNKDDDSHPFASLAQLKKNR